ncbi:MAG: hypothetical protein JWL85_798 [Candidatus Saccharibacteria bacterium]|nr:hypothetical protein [Candidatus Saccharibacteria bacterium]
MFSKAAVAAIVSAFAGALLGSLLAYIFSSLRGRAINKQIKLENYQDSLFILETNLTEVAIKAKKNINILNEWQKHLQNGTQFMNLPDNLTHAKDASGGLISRQLTNKAVTLQLNAELINSSIRELNDFYKVFREELMKSRMNSHKDDVNPHVTILNIETTLSMADRMKSYTADHYEKCLELLALIKIHENLNDIHARKVTNINKLREYKVPSKILSTKVNQVKSKIESAVIAIA